MDDIDRQIIAHLTRHGRASYREVGSEVGLSAPAVKRRVDRLVDDGTIEGFAAQVDPHAMGWTTDVFVSIFATGNIPPNRIRAAVEPVPEVHAAYTVTGDADALLHVRVRDTRHLEEVLETIRRQPFVAQTRSLVVLSRLLERGVTVADGD
ncbi:MAG TPA: Lrp/AsnC family transcriptional regulator [Nitriliruptoraceae bacterium]|nr:Lrp/AsnC family transcriptional regulator [Nitriliruptoraceae bacterium]